MFSAFNPSKCTHTVVNTHTHTPCTHTWSSGQPTLRRPGRSWGFGVLLKGLTSVVNNSCRSRDSNPQPRVTSPTLYPLEPRLSRLRNSTALLNKLTYSGDCQTPLNTSRHQCLNQAFIHVERHSYSTVHY